jgi:hypothetical protein
LHFVGAMNVLQEQVSRVIHTNDVTEVEPVSRSVLQMPAPDPRAAELRDRLLVILSELTRAANKREQTDPGLTDELKKWKKDYLEWFKGAH